jgi:PAS domain S-box-containing protein
MNKSVKYLRRYTIVIVFFWSLTILGFLGWRLNHINVEIEESARHHAELHFKWIRTIRHWVASYGGVYLHHDERTPPNKYLDVPERDIVTPSGKELTLMNPAYMTRQVFTEYEEELGFTGHITSLNPINPQNAPDGWERAALEGFERGNTEVIELTEIDGELFIRLMRPLKTVKACLKCHAQQGYKIGDIRGGITISVPITPFILQKRHEWGLNIFIFILIWVTGVYFGYFGYKRLSKQIISLKSTTVELKKSRKGLSEAEQKLALHVQQTPLGVIEWSVDFKVTAWNPAAEKIFGFSSSEAIGHKPIEIIIPEIAKEHVDRIWSDILKQRGGTRSTNENITRDGKTIICEWYNTPLIDSDGTVIGIASLVHDVTDRMRAEEERERLSTAISQSAETIVITDTEGSILYANPAFEKTTGYTHEEAIGQNSRLLKSGKHPVQFYSNLWATIKRGEIWSGQFINKKKDGTLFEEDATISPILNADGKIVNFVAVKRDITHESMLKRSRDYFTSVTSHELRTPLTALKLVERLMKDIGKEVSDKKKFEKITDALESSHDGLNRILEATTLLDDLNTPKTEKHFHPVYLHTDITSRVEITTGIIKRNNRRLKLDMDLDRLPMDTEVIGDEAMINRAIDNILSNAVKYTQDGKTIKVTAKIKNGNAVISVHDEGIGIPKEEMDIIFEPYFSLENVLEHSTGEYSYKGGGLGLGLALASMILDYHGGKLEVASEGENMGTDVTMTFPTSNRKA